MQKVKTQKSRTDSLDVAKVMKEFQEAEESTAHRKGTFKIEKPFEEALDTILKVNPGPNKTKAKT